MRYGYLFPSHFQPRYRLSELFGQSSRSPNAWGDHPVSIFPRERISSPPADSRRLLLPAVLMLAAAAPGWRRAQEETTNDNPPEAAPRAPGRQDEPLAKPPEIPEVKLGSGPAHDPGAARPPVRSMCRWSTRPCCRATRRESGCSISRSSPCGSRRSIFPARDVARSTTSITRS